MSSPYRLGCSDDNSIRRDIIGIVNACEQNASVARASVMPSHPPAFMKHCFGENVFVDIAERARVRFRFNVTK